ncbi:hypothetical protein F4677DRAFT_462846 [Hypoxylon crocopeplum]|nr:hypothetical protein F4677DRAFT_462846 [Hypoxylon crocopeplum]
MRLSGLQKEVLSLYRNCLRESRKKPTKGSPNRRPKITYLSSASPNEKPSQQAAQEVFRTPLPEPLVRERRRQRRISRNKHGVRVSRRLPSRGTGESSGGDKQYSLMQVSEFTEDHPYWGTLRQSQIYSAGPRVVDATEPRRPYKNRTHVQTADYDNIPAERADDASQKFKGRRKRGMSIMGRGRGRTREKRFGLADPVVWDAINRSLVQQRRLSTLVIPEETAVDHMQQLDVPSRTSSQRKALNRFTRQLEKYADVAGAARKVPVMTPTESDSKVSYHTVQPLLPYRKEFQAAGLAVTSTEQSRGPPTRPGGNHLPMRANMLVQMSGELDGQDETESEQFSSSSGSFVEFTPAGQPIEQLPTSKSKSQQKSTSTEKRGIFPWLRRKPTTRETHSSQLEPQQTQHITKDGRVQSRVKTIDSQHPRGRRQPRVLENQLPPVPTTVPPAIRSRKPTKSPAKVMISKELPRRALSPVKFEQRDPGPSSALATSRMYPDLGPRQPAAHTGLRKRDYALARLPRPETIEEEKENLPIHLEQTKAQAYPRPQSRDGSIGTTVINQQPHYVSPQTTPSTVPSLPSVAQYAVGRPSSLERALEEVSQHLDKMEQEADKSVRLCSRPPTLVEKTNQKEQRGPSHAPDPPDQKPSENTPTRRPGLNEEVMFVNRRMPLVESPKPPKPKSKSKSKSKSTKPLPSTPRATRDTQAPRQKKPSPSPPKEKTLPKTPRTEKVLNDLDVFFDYDDADINDRDVIRGLQVAIHAAADNTYDALIRERTGLRIRRFLADLRAVGETQ